MIKRRMMRCGRCDGLMVVDFFIDMGEVGGQLWLRAWRCVNCGAVEEPLITRHQLAQGLGIDPFVERMSKRSRGSYKGVLVGV